jgi:alkylated DNA repair protein alkB homolog 1
LQITKIELNQNIPKIGLIPPNQWKAFSFKNKPGLILVKNPFTSIGQRYWVKKLLKDYTKYPNPNNLLPSRFNEEVIINFWGSLNTECDEQQKRLIKKSMRWTTLGYHYDWTNKIYDENKKNEFPPDLHQLIATVADVLGFKDYKSEAAIINFYPIGTTLSAHTDHSEFYLESPLFSISFGQAAIFLIGGHEREDEVVPILLNSGDILVMAKESRLCYHAVPRVFKCEKQEWNDDKQVTHCTDLDQDEVLESLKDENWKPFENYLIDSRINVNVRQVNK